MRPAAERSYSHFKSPTPGPPQFALHSKHLDGDAHLIPDSSVWLRENRARFAVPVRVTKITARGVELKFPGYPDCLSVSLWGTELRISVDWKGENWDSLVCLDCVPRRVPGGYRCKLCTEDPITIWPTREPLWQDHFFEPLLTWVNERLAHASWLSLYGRPGRTTWVELVDANDDSPEPESLWAGIPLPLAPSRLPAEQGPVQPVRLNGRARARATEDLLKALVPLPKSE